MSEPNDRERELAAEWACIDLLESDIADMLANYRAELTSDAEVLRRAEQILREAGVARVHLCSLASGNEASVSATAISPDFVDGATLAEAVAALKEGT